MKTKIIDNGYIMMVSDGGEGIEITEEEYNAILGIIRNAPTTPEGYVYRLREDLDWELCEPPPAPDPGEAYTEDTLMGMSNAELTEILTEMEISVTMNKVNMVRLILATQGVFE